jgi:hypothetical protein
MYNNMCCIRPVYYVQQLEMVLYLPSVIGRQAYTRIYSTPSLCFPTPSLQPPPKITSNTVYNEVWWVIFGLGTTYHKEIEDMKKRRQERKPK